jgi:hypothetical protein
MHEGVVVVVVVMMMMNFVKVSSVLIYVFTVLIHTSSRMWGQPLSNFSHLAIDIVRIV